MKSGQRQAMNMVITIYCKIYRIDFQSRQENIECHGNHDALHSMVTASPTHQSLLNKTSTDRYGTAVQVTVSENLSKKPGNVTNTWVAKGSSK